MEKPFEFNPLTCRTPVGAITQGTKVFFKIKIRSDIYLSGLSLVVLGDREKTVWKIPAAYAAGEQPDFYYFTADCDFNANGLYFYYFECAQNQHKFYLCADAFLDAYATGKVQDSWQMTVCRQDAASPAWMNGKTMYQIFPDRFYKAEPAGEKRGAILHENWGETPCYLPIEGKILNNDFFGGNLQGIIEKLDYLKDLGIGVLYLCPIFKAASNHRYDTGDYSEVDELLGTNEDFERLAKECEKRDMRIILDGVFNHTGDDSKYFNKYGRYDGEGAYQSQNSAYRDWYRFINYPNVYHSWWGIDTLPSVNQDSPSYREYIAGEGGIVEKWLKLGSGGWRLDVVDELNDGILDQICGRAKTAKQDAVVIGEVWEDASNKSAYGVRRRYFEGGQLDSVMNYPIKNAIITFVKSRSSAAFVQEMNMILDHYPKRVLDNLMNILSTHDTARILTVLGFDSFPATRKERAETFLDPQKRQRAKQLLKLATLMQFTVPGVPCVYYGDEAGLEGFEDPFNRRCYPWGQEDCEIRDWYHLLGKIRREHKVFQNGKFQFLLTEERAVIYSRGDDEIIVGINLGDEPVVIPVRGKYRDLIYGSESSEIMIMPYSPMLMQKS